MFKRLKRIEALVREFVEMERRIEEIVQRREIKYALWDARNNALWKCPFPECTVQPYHLHTLPVPDSDPNPSSEPK